MNQANQAIDPTTLVAMIPAAQEIAAAGRVICAYR